MVFYFVQRGETLYHIAKRYDTTVHAIVVANRLEDPNAICPGQALIIPRAGEVPSPPPGGIVHLVRPGETVFHLAERFGTSVPDILKANQIAHPEFVLSGQQVVIPEQVEPGEDWPMVGRTPGRSAASPVILEGRPFAGWTYQPRRASGVRPSAPVLRYDRIYAGLGDGYFYALDRVTGRVKWRLPGGGAKAGELLGIHGMAAPAIYDGLAYLASADGTVHAVDAHSGQWVWKVSLGSVISAAPAVQDGVIYLATWEGEVCALEAKTGAVAWRSACNSPVYRPVAAGDEHVYVTPEDQVLWALDAETGEVVWKTAAENPCPPVFAEVLVICGGQAFDPKTGTKVWELEGAGASPVAYFDQLVYPWGMVDLFSGRSGEGQDAEVAIAADRQGAGVMAHVAAGAHLIRIGADRQVEGRLVSTQELTWSYPLPADVAQPPAIGPDQLILTMVDGGVMTIQFAPN